MTDRTTELRRALVATVDAAPYEKPRPRRWVAAAAIAAFAVAGSVTGFATATVSQAAPSEQPSEATAAWVLSYARANSEFLGPIQHVAASEAADLTLGSAPDGASGVVVVLSCSGTGKVSLLVDGTSTMTATCTTGDGGGGLFPVPGDGEHTLRFEAGDGAKYEAWAAWVREPPLPQPTQQQQLEISDGVVTRAEYVAAYNRFIGCMAAGGYDVGGFTQSDDAGLLSYVVPSAAVTDGTDEFCYETEFKQVDIGWQISQE
ncbi:hypothetical protein BH11ACT5_BH11ACT5_27800 [soil metagenome]